MDPIFLDHSFDKEFENAIIYLVLNIQTTCNNPKPVILHSIKVGMTLFQLGYPKELVIAGILHDLIEDSAVTKEMISDKFGTQITEIVIGNSFNKNIGNLEDRYKDTFRRCQEKGKNALIVKTADIYENLGFFIYATKEIEGGLENSEYLIEKNKYFAFLAKEIIGTESIYKLMEERLLYFEKLVRNSKKI